MKDPPLKQVTDEEIIKSVKDDKKSVIIGKNFECWRINRRFYKTILLPGPIS